MRELPGKAFQMIRNNKGFSQEDITVKYYNPNSSTPSNLSKFENQNTNVGFNTLTEWLNKMNMTLYEFSTYIETEGDTYVDDFDAIRRAYKRNDSRSLQYLKEHFYKKRKTLPRNNYLSILCDLLISRINKSELDHKKAEVLEDYLVTC